MEESRKSRTVLKQFNFTHIVVIAKVKSPKSFSDFRPISLCNIVYKIFTKAIYLRLFPFISKIMFKEQGDFVPQRKIVEGALVTHEVLHTIQSNKLLSFIVKLDTMKAYTKVD